MSYDPLLENYEMLKQKIKQYENEYYSNFNNLLYQLRQSKFKSGFKNSYEGNIYNSKQSGSFKVLEYFNYDNIAIEFINTGYKMIARANNINRGEVKDPYAISILGVGYIGIGPYKTDRSPFDRMIYSRWRGIIERCYILKEGNKYMHPEWFNFQYFAAWFYSEFYIVPDYTMYDMCVDKDVLYPTNWEYGPDKCIIIPSIINNKIQLKDYDRIMISKCLNGELSEKETRRMYTHKLYRESIVKNLADQYKSHLPPHVYLALINYQMF